MVNGLGSGTTEEFFTSELASLALKDKRLKARAIKIFTALQEGLTSCVRRLFDDPKDARQAYDFFFQPQSFE